MQPKLWFLLGVREPHLDQARAWLAGLEGPKTIVFPVESELSRLDFAECETLSVRQHLVPTSSDEEEAVFKYVDEYFNELPSRLPEIELFGVNLCACTRNLLNLRPESMVVVARAIGLAIQNRPSMANIVIWFEHYNFSGLAILDEAANAGLCDPETAILRGTANGLEPPGRILDKATPARDIPVIVQRACDAGKGYAPEHGEARPPGGIMHILTTTVSEHVPYIELARQGLRETSSPAREIALHENVRELFSKNGADVQLLRDVKDSCAQDHVTITQTLVALFERLLEFGDRHQAPASPASLGTNTLEYVWRRVANPTIIKRAYEYCLDLERLQEYIQKDRPGCIYYYPNLSRLDPAISQLARRNGSLTVSSIFLSVTAEYRNLNLPTTDLITVLGSAQEQALIQRGFPVERVIPVGAPLVDENARNWNPERARRHIAEEDGLSLEQYKVVLVATSGLNVGDELRWLEWLIKLLPDFPDVFLLIKLHRSTFPQPYHELLIRSPHERVYLKPEGDIWPYLTIADLVITDVSHVGKFAVYLDKRLWVANISGRPFAYNRFDESGVADLADCEERFRDLLVDVASEDIDSDRRIARRRFTEAEFTSADGKSIQRLMTTLLRSASDRSVHGVRDAVTAGAPTS